MLELKNGKHLKFTLHGLFRQMTRLENLTEKKLESMILSGKAVFIGDEKGTNREHYLFYCREKSEYFTTIVDVRTAEVITIMPLSYHDNISWVVSEIYKREALDKAFPDLLDIVDVESDMMSNYQDQPIQF